MKNDPCIIVATCINPNPSFRFCGCCCDMLILNIHWTLLECMPLYLQAFQHCYSIYVATQGYWVIYSKFYFRARCSSPHLPPVTKQGQPGLTDITVHTKLHAFTFIGHYRHNHPPYLYIDNFLPAGVLIASLFRVCVTAAAWMTAVPSFSRQGFFGVFRSRQSH